MDKVTPINSIPRESLSDPQLSNAGLSNAGLSDEEQILQIRELLFGEQGRAHDQYVEHLFSELEKKLEHRLDKIDSQVQQLSAALQTLDNKLQKFEHGQAAGFEHALLQEREELSAALRTLAAGFDRKRQHRD